MCGIVGMSLRMRNGNIGFRTHDDLNKLRKMFTEMLVDCQSRGSSATGVVLSYFDDSPVQLENRKPRVAVLKAPIPAEEFVKLDQFKKLLDKLDNNSYFIIGHTRAVTHGSAEDNRNNHPHMAGKIIGVHNGAIRNHRKIWDSLKDGGLKPLGDCDSEAIFALVENYRKGGDTIAESIKKTVDQLDGWYALAMVDIRSPTKMVFVRDDNTPLHMAWYSTCRATFIASDKLYIDRAARKVGFSSVLLDHVHVPGKMVHVLDSLRAVTSYTSDVERFLIQGDSYKLSDEDKKLYDKTNGLEEGGTVVGIEDGDDSEYPWTSMN